MKKYVIFYSVLIILIISFDTDPQVVTLLPDEEIFSGEVITLNNGYEGDEDGNRNNHAGDIRGYTDGSLKEAQFADIFGITLDQNGAIYLTEPSHDRIRKIVTE